MHSAGLKFSVTRNHYSPITLAMDEHHVAPALSIQMKPRALQRSSGTLAELRLLFLHTPMAGDRTPWVGRHCSSTTQETQPNERGTLSPAFGRSVTP